MERKYYLRGLGVGIAVTAIIMGIALSGDQAMTDDEIIARAKELGMVENTVLAVPDNEETGEEDADIQDETDRTDAAAVNGQDSAAGAADDEEDTVTLPVDETKDSGGAPPVDGAEDRETEAEPDAKDNDGTQAPAAAKDNGGAQAPAATKDNGEADTAENTNEIITSAAVKTITVNHGDGSYTVAKKLEDVGVVTSAATFDTFLCQNGYDKRLRTGTFSIPADASDEQIARIVTGAE